jgi:hypothetical protein
MGVKVRRSADDAHSRWPSTRKLISLRSICISVSGTTEESILKKLHLNSESIMERSSVKKEPI